MRIKLNTRLFDLFATTALGAIPGGQDEPDFSDVSEFVTADTYKSLSVKLGDPGVADEDRTVYLTEAELRAADALFQVGEGCNDAVSDGDYTAINAAIADAFADAG
jgi:hypothetical protein